MISGLDKFPIPIQDAIMDQIMDTLAREVVGDACMDLLTGRVGFDESELSEYARLQIMDT
jgi:hypothetical protein